MSTVFVLQQLEPGRWPRSVRAFNPAISHSAGSCPLYFTAHGSPSTRSLPGGRPVLADAHPGTPAQGTPARQTGHGMPAHCVTADASGYHSSYHIQATTLYCREMWYRSHPGGHKPKLQRRAAGILVIFEFKSMSAKLLLKWVHVTFGICPPKYSQPRLIIS